MSPECTTVSLTFFFCPRRLTRENLVSKNVGVFSNDVNFLVKPFQMGVSLVRRKSRDFLHGLSLPTCEIGNMSVPLWLSGLINVFAYKGIF